MELSPSPELSSISTGWRSEGVAHGRPEVFVQKKFRLDLGAKCSDFGSDIVTLAWNWARTPIFEVPCRSPEGSSSKSAPRHRSEL